MPHFLWAQTGPGGFGTTSGDSNLKFWMDANNGISGSGPVSAISDLSGSGVVSVVNGDPSLTTSSLNGYNVITFDGAGDFISTNLSINAGVMPDVSIISLYTPRVDNAGGVWGEDDANWDRFIFDKTNLHPNYHSAVPNGTGPVTNISNIFPLATPVITSVIFREDVVNGTNVYANESLESTFTSNMGPEISNNFTIGDIGSNLGIFDFDGDIAEIIVVDKAINTSERIIIHNYLAAKYGVSLVNNDVYNQDEPASGNYDHDVAGIGQASDGTNHTDSQGTGTVRILNPSNLDNDEFMMWGHNNGNPQAVEFFDVPVGIQARLGRVWRVSEVNTSGVGVDVGAVDIRFDLNGLGPITASDLRLLVDSDDDGSFNDEAPISGTVSLGSGIYEYQSVTAIDNNARFTIATANRIQTPLPVELTSFVVVPYQGDNVILKWETASEIDNDYFRVEKSVNGTDWKYVGREEGAGNSSSTNAYSMIDKSPYMGLSYYRLKQVDFNGEFKYEQMRSIKFTHDHSALNTYPNPSIDYLTVEMDFDSMNSDVILYNLSGKSMQNHIRIISQEKSKIVFDITSLSAGVYYLKRGTEVKKVIKVSPLH